MQQRYRAGVSTLIDLLDTQRVQFSAQQNVVAGQPNWSRTSCRCKRASVSAGACRKASRRKEKQAGRGFEQHEAADPQGVHPQVPRDPPGCAVLRQVPTGVAKRYSAAAKPPFFAAPHPSTASGSSHHAAHRRGWYASRLKVSLPNARKRVRDHLDRYARSTQMNHAEMQFLSTDFPYKSSTATSSAASGSSPSVTNTSTISRRSPASRSRRFRVRAKPISNLRSMPRTRPRLPGARPRRPNARTCSTRSPTESRRTSCVSRSPRRSTTASRCAKRWPRTFRSRSITSAISRAARVRRKVRSRRSTTIRWPTISMNRSASSGRSFRGISRS